jgi:GGDEF domain-containing protein
VENPAVTASVAFLVLGSVRQYPLAARVIAELALIAGLARMLLTFREVRTLAETRHQALTDESTGLPSRRMFYRQAEQTITDAPVEGQPLAMLLIDLDR